MSIKKIIAVLAVGLLLTSCSRGWSCKARYVNAKKPIVTERKAA